MMMWRSMLTLKHTLLILGFNFWDLFKNTPDYEFVDWDLSGSTQEEYENLMAIFNAEEKKSISWITTI